MPKNKKGFTLVELLAVIVILAIVMGLAAVAITSVLNNTRRSAFVTDAKSFIEGARDLVNSDALNDLLGTSGGNYAPSCANGTGETNFIPVSAIRLESGGETSPYGNPYQKGTGTVAVTTRLAGRERPLKSLVIRLREPDLIPGSDAALFEIGLKGIPKLPSRERIAAFVDRIRKLSPVLGNGDEPCRAAPAAAHLLRHEIPVGKHLSLFFTFDAHIRSPCLPFSR